MEILLPLDLPHHDNEKKASAKNEANKIDEVLIPQLHKYGFLFEWVKYLDVKKTYIKTGNSELDEIKQLLWKRRHGLLAKISHRRQPEKFIYVQPKVIYGTDSRFLKTYPHVNTAPSIVTKMEEADLDTQEVVYEHLKEANIHFLIMTMSGVFWFNKFSDFPIHYYDLTYRKTITKLYDRLRFVSKYQKNNWHYIEQEFRSILLNYIHGNK